MFALPAQIFSSIRTSVGFSMTSATLRRQSPEPLTLFIVATCGVFDDVWQGKRQLTG
jgi:hypothetical protein